MRRRTKVNAKSRMQQLWLPAPWIPGLDLEPLLRGDLLQSMAAVLMKCCPDGSAAETGGRCVSPVGGGCGT